MINDARRLREWVTTEVDQLLAESWRSGSGSWDFTKSGVNDFDDHDHRVRAQLELLARLAAEAGDHATPARMEREWSARYREYRARGGPGRYMMLHIEEVRQIDRDRFAITQPCPVCDQPAERFCQYSDGSYMEAGFHAERYELPDRFGITRDCPACHAPAGDPCRTSGGNVRADTHASRKGDPVDVRVADVACPACHAGPGRPCRTASRKIATAMHGERRLAMGRK